MQLPKQILRYLTGIFYSFDEITCTNLSKFFENLAHDSFNRCLHKDINWDRILLQISFRLFFPKGGYLIIDEVIIPKQYAEYMEGLHLFKDPITQEYYQSYKVIVLAWSNGMDICIPLSFRIWQKPIDGKTALDLALELLNQARRWGIKPECVLFDSYYASKKVLNTLNSWNWIFCTQLKSNRFFNNQRITKRSILPYWTATGELKDCEGMKVVVVKHGHKYFCTNNLNLGHKSVRMLYKKRWPIEEIFRFSKQKLGLKQCQSTSLNAQRAHITMCFMAYTMLQKESQIKNISDYKIKTELSFQRANFNLFTWDLLFV